MIGRLRGLLAAKHSTSVVVDVGGVGYEIAVTPRALVDLPSVGEEAVVHTHMYVREDQMALFGFTEAEERDLFRILIGVSGVGPKVALAMLATMNATQLHRAVMSEDVDALTMVPGIGKRSAQKLILELRPRLDMPDTDLLPTGSVLGEVRSALEALGYQNTEIREVTKDLPVEGSVEDLLRSALQTLGQGNR